MEILQTAIVNDITLSINDRWDSGNGVNIVLKEIFEIGGQVYLSTITEGHVMVGFKINKDSDEVITPNRYINLAEIWVKKNKQLFTNKLK
jgi:hypothetical protein